MWKLILSFLFLSTAALAQVSDRPGAGDSPDSQKPGTWRVETSLAGYNKSDDVKKYSLGQITYFSRGLKNSELQIGQVGGLDWIKVEGVDTDSNVGELSLRYKYSLGELFCETCRFGVLASLTMPQKNETRLKSYEKVVSIPMSFGLSPNFSLGVNFAWTHLNDFAATDSSFVLNYSVTDSLSVFVQQVVSTNKSDLDQESFSSGFGAAYVLRKNWQIDMEFNQGMSSLDQSSDLQVGMTYWFN